MGADRFIRSLYDEQTRVWRPLFDEALQKRSRCKPDTPEYETAQKRVDKCFQCLNDVGYFRDPYNGWDILWQFGLSWWNDIIPLLDKDRRLAVVSVKRFIAMLDAHQYEFEGNMVERTPEDREYFESQAKELRRVLGQAVELNEPIDCSV